MIEEELIRDEAEAQAHAIRVGADNLRTQASDIEEAKTMNTVSTILGGVTQALPSIGAGISSYMSNQKKKKNNAGGSNA